MLNTVGTSQLYHANTKTLPTLLITEVLFISRELHQPYLGWLDLLGNPGSNASELCLDEHKIKDFLKVAINLSGKSGYYEVEIGPQYILYYLQEESVSTCKSQGSWMVNLPAIFTAAFSFFSSHSTYTSFS